MSPAAVAIIASNISKHFNGDRVRNVPVSGCFNSKSGRVGRDLNPGAFMSGNEPGLSSCWPPAADLSPVSAWVLVQLDPDHAISQKELAARLHCNPSTLVDPTDRLEESGLAVRRPQPADRRINILTVTPKGRQVRHMP